MRVVCAAVVEDSRLQKNLCECVGILGGVPNRSGNTICVEYEGEEPTVNQFIELFEHYCRHEIHEIA